MDVAEENKPESQVVSISIDKTSCCAEFQLLHAGDVAQLLRFGPP